MSFSADCWAPSSGISLHGIPAFLQVPRTRLWRLRRCCYCQSGFGSILYSGWTMTLVFIVLAPLIGMFDRVRYEVILMWISTRNHRQRSIGSFAGFNCCQRRSTVWDMVPTMRRNNGHHYRAACFIRILSDISRSVLGHHLLAHCNRYGTLFGGWRIVKTMGQKVTKLKPADGFCAETAGELRCLQRHSEASA